MSSKEVSLAEAKAIKGLRAVFGEVRGAQLWGAAVEQTTNRSATACA